MRGRYPRWGGEVDTPHLYNSLPAGPNFTRWGAAGCSQHGKTPEISVHIINKEPHPAIHRVGRRWATKVGDETNQPAKYSLMTSTTSSLEMTSPK